NLFTLEPVAQTELSVEGDRESHPEIAAGIALAIGGHVGEVDLLVEEVEARGEVAIEEMRLGEAEIDLSALKASGEAGAEGQFASGLLLDPDDDDHAVRGAAGLGLDFHRLEVSERAQAAAGGL